MNTTILSWVSRIGFITMSLLAYGATAQAQVGPQSMKYLADMQGYIALQRIMVLPAPVGAQAGTGTAFKRSAGVYTQAMNEAAQQIAKGGASVGMVSRMTGSGYFSNAARKYGQSIGLAHADTDVSHAVAGLMAICRQAEKNEETNATQASQLLSTVQKRLSAQPSLAQAGDSGRQAMADAVNTQTGLAFWNIQGRKKTASNNKELAYYCGQGLKRLGIALDQL
jgi:hypothetical protein